MLLCPHFGGMKGSRLSSVSNRGQIPRRTLAICQIRAFSKPAAGNLLAFSGQFADTGGVLLQ
jgi:hypothetical protein